MAVDKKISQLASGAPAQAGDEYVVARSGANYKLTLTNIAASMPPIGATTPNTGAFTTLSASSGATISGGNLTFSSTAQRITGDFSNATPANRVAFQSSTTNGNTNVMVLPNGTGTVSGVVLESSSDLNSSSNTQLLVINGSDSRITSGIRGTGSYLPMTFYTGGSERVRIDTSGQVGIGATPSAWTATFKVLQVSSSSLYNNGANATFVGSNYFFDGTNNKYINSATAAAYAQNGGEHIWYNAASGTAGNNVTFTERMRIDTSGNVGIGLTPSYKLDVNRGSVGDVARFTNGVDATLIVGAPTGGITYNQLNGGYQAWQTAGTERMRIDSSGNVAVGYADATRGRFGVFNSQSDGAQTLANSGLLFAQSGGWAQAGIYPIGSAGFAGTLVFATSPSGSATWTPTERMRIDSSGNVGIGTASPSTGVHLNRASGNTYYRAQNGTANVDFGVDSAGNGILWNNSNYPLLFGTNNVERVRISAAGLVGVGQGTPNARLDVLADSGDIGRFINSSGTGVSIAAGNNTWTSLSDESVKTDLIPIADAVPKIASLRAVTGRFTSDDVGVSRSFLIAQDVQKVFPEAVNVVDKEKNLLGLAYTDVIPLLVKAVQELTARVAELEAK